MNEIGIFSKIYLIRGERVMLDYDLAQLYGIETRVLKQAVKRHIERFPKDFMFEIDKEESEVLRSQIVISKNDDEEGRGGSRYLSFAFTEQGVAMLSTVLNSQRAIEVNIAIMRTFVQVRGLMASNKELEEKINDLEKKYDEQFSVVFDAIRSLIKNREEEQKKIGF